MLCLGRKTGERVRIGDDIVVTVVGIRHDGTVRLGFEAPPHVKVLRDELILHSDEAIRTDQTV